MDEKIRDLNKRIDKMITYLLLKVEMKDWHAVADAAMDLRELEAERKVEIKYTHVGHPGELGLIQAEIH